jgi:hypothetical protein
MMSTCCGNPHEISRRAGLREVILSDEGYERRVRRPAQAALGAVDLRRRGRHLQQPVVRPSAPPPRLLCRTPRSAQRLAAAGCCLASGHLSSPLLLVWSTRGRGGGSANDARRTRRGIRSATACARARVRAGTTRGGGRGTRRAGGCRASRGGSARRSRSGCGASPPPPSPPPLRPLSPSRRLCRPRW